MNKKSNVCLCVQPWQDEEKIVCLALLRKYHKMCLKLSVFNLFFPSYFCKSFDSHSVVLLAVEITVGTKIIVPLKYGFFVAIIQYLVVKQMADSISL